MSWYIFVILFIGVIILKAFLMQPAFEKNQNYDELLRFFSPDGKFTALQIAEIIKERTGGRRDVSDSNVRYGLRQLCKEGKLCNENYQYSQTRSVTRYFLHPVQIK